MRPRMSTRFSGDSMGKCRLSSSSFTNPKFPMHSSWAHDRDNMCIRVRRLFAGRIPVPYNANCAHSFGLLLLASTLHTCPHTLACCASSCKEWQTSHWQKWAQKDVSRLSKSSHQPLGSNTSSCKTPTLCFGSNNAGGLPGHQGKRD